MARLKLIIREDKISLRIKENKISMNIAPAKTVYLGGDMYDGEYEVVPSLGEQVLQTSGMILMDDVTVFPIPYAEVSNIYGGKTVTIGG